jgi:type I restriction enzyme, S subunit
VSREATSPFPAKRLKYVVSLRRSRVDGSEDDRPYVGLENIESWTGKRLGDSAAINEESSSTTIEGTSLSNTFEPGDVLFGKLRPYLAKAWVAEFPGRSTTELLVMQPVEAESRFLRYVCLWREFVDAVDASTFGSKMPRADWDFIGNMPIPVPDWPKQRAIADYLDRETARIDALIAAKERVLGLLAEKRRALITRAVTRGLDPNAPLRDSGIPWLGEIPAHWDTLPLKRLVIRIESGVSVNAANYPAAAEELGVLKTSAVLDGRFLANENKCVLESEMDRVACPVRANSVIMSRMNTPSLVGEVGYVERDYPELFLPDRLWQIGFDNQLVRTRFIALVMTSSGLRGVFSEMATGTSGSMKNLSQEDALGVKVPLPPMDEQTQVVAFVLGNLEGLVRLVSATQRTITLLKERRGALIAAAVTGQIDVGSAA